MRNGRYIIQWLQQKYFACNKVREKSENETKNSICRAPLATTNFLVSELICSSITSSKLCFVFSSLLTEKTRFPLLLFSHPIQFAYTFAFAWLSHWINDPSAPRIVISFVHNMLCHPFDSFEFRAFCFRCMFFRLNIHSITSPMLISLKSYATGSELIVYLLWIIKHLRVLPLLREHEFNSASGPAIMARRWVRPSYRIFSAEGNSLPQWICHRFWFFDVRNAWHFCAFLLYYSIWRTEHTLHPCNHST